MTALRARIKPGKASLIGGIAVGVAAFVLWVGIAHEFGRDTLPWMALGLLVSVGIAIWVRAADL
jgi:hypothetical protein